MLDWIKDDLKGFGAYVENDSDIEQLTAQKVDISFIGSGLSSSYTLIEYLDQIRALKNEDNRKPINILLIEKDSWFWGGIPYGRRSGFTTLIITPLDEFLPSEELPFFIDWMADNIDWLITPFVENAGSRSKKWLIDSIKKIKLKDSAKLHIPRYFFGIYIWEKLKVAAEKSSNYIKLSMIRAEVTAIKHCPDKQNQYEIHLENNKFTFITSQILLGVGIPEIRSLQHDVSELKDIMFINDPYKPDIQSNIEKINIHINKHPDTKILIVGANASALELIYQITNIEDYENKNIKLTVLSPQGKLPNLFIKDKETSFLAHKLQKLSDSSIKLTADLILDAFIDDLSFADTNDYDISDTLPIFTSHVGNLVKKLSKEEKYKFISFHGLEIGRLQRRAGMEYTQPIKELFSLGGLEVIKGKFNNFVNYGNKSIVSYQKEGSDSIYKDYFNIVINCAGSSGLNKTNISPLLLQLLNSKLCTPTISNYGISVGNNFDVSPGFFINGPLLAGNVVDDMGIWHVEHCGRIISFSKKIANYIVDDRRLRLSNKNK